MKTEEDISSKRTKQKVKHLGLQVLSILVPIVILAAAYVSMDIYPGSERTMLASDASPQLSNFYASFHRVLHGEQSLLYTWSGTLGLNYWALSAYYLNSIFTPLVYFFDNLMIPDTLYYLTLLKFGLSGGAFYYFARHTFKLKSYYLLGFSWCYALMGFTVAYSPMIMWLDAMIYLPLIILGIHRVMDDRKPFLLFISYLLLFLSNFYIAFMVGVFSFCYYWLRFIQAPKRYRESIVPYLAASLSAGLTSMITILPTILDLRNNGETLTSVTTWLTPDTGQWDIVIKSMAGVYDTAKFSSAPFIYIGILPVLLFITYFLNGNISIKERLFYGVFAVFFICSFYIEPLNLFWHGFHAPNMLLFRFSFLYSFLALYLAGRSLERLDKKQLNRLVNVALSLILLFLAAWFFSNRKRYSFLTNTSVIVSILLVVFYLGYLVYSFSNKKSRFQRFVPLLLLTVIIAELGFNTKAMVEGVKADWVYPRRSSYTQYHEEINELVTLAKEDSSQFFRMDNLDATSINESFNFGYSGIDMFSSIRNRNSAQYLQKMGYRSEGTNLYTEGKNNTLLMDSLVGVKYKLSKTDPLIYGYEKIAEGETYQLYETPYSLPLGILTDPVIYDQNLDTQSDLLNYLAEDEQLTIKTTTVKEIKTENIIAERENNTLIYSAKQIGQPMTAEWTVDVPANQQVYFALYGADNSIMSKVYAEVTVDGQTRNYSMKRVGQYYNLGYHEKAGTVSVKMTFSGNSVVAFPDPTALLIDGLAYEKVMTAIQSKGVEVSVHGRHVEAEVNTDKEQVLFTTIPYDKGWTAEIDGKPVEIQAYENAFVSLKIPKGNHRVTLNYFPQGMKLGMILSFMGISGFLSYLFWLRHQTKNRLNEGK